MRVLSDGEAVSIDGTHLGHNLPDSKGNRYCMCVGDPSRPRVRFAPARLHASLSAVRCLSPLALRAVCPDSNLVSVAGLPSDSEDKKAEL